MTTPYLPPPPPPPEKAFVSLCLLRMSSVKLASMLLAVMVVPKMVISTSQGISAVTEVTLITDRPNPVTTDPPTPVATDPPTPVATDPPTPVATDPPTPVATDPPTPVATDPPTPVATDPPTPVATDPPTPVATNYCNISSCSGRSHVLCDDPGSPSYYFLDHCYNTGSQSGVPTDDQKVIVDAHNTIRWWVRNGKNSNNRLPAAKTLPKVTWHDELAKVAQGYLNRCRSRHSCLDVPSFSVGHISHRDGGTWPHSAKDWKKIIINNWFKIPLQFFQNKNLIYTGSSKTLFQLIWAKTTKVGCGIMTRDGERGEKYLFYFCAYGPGIVKGEMSYEAKP